MSQKKGRDTNDKPVSQNESGNTTGRPDPSTAPEVSGKLLKDIGAEAVETPSKDKKAKVTISQAIEQAKAEPNSEDLPLSGKSTPLSDRETDEAVDDIAVDESDTMLALQDVSNQDEAPPRSGFREKLRRILRSKWTWIGLLVIIIALFAVPVTRYKLLGIFIKKPVTVTVLDSKTNVSVSNATVKLAGKSGRTNGDGLLTLKVSPGHTKLIAGKQYYTTASKQYFVALKSGAKVQIRLVATGRQVPITVLNTITGQPVANAEITALKTTAKTNARGQATIVLPANAAADKGGLALAGYNTQSVNIQVTNQAVSANTFKLTPAGHVYFLANSDGTIDVDKTELDGSNRQTVLAGTGKEDPAQTFLLASRDWHYLALESSRDSGQGALYIINTSNDKVTEFDSSNAQFSLIGWSGHDFVYDVVSNTVNQSQTGHEAVKSYDADNQQLNQLDQNQGDSGTYQHFYNFYVLNDLVLYTTQWYADGGSLSGKLASIRGVQPGGQNKKDYQTFSSDNLGTVQAALYQPQAVYYAVPNTASGQVTYYNFQNQTVDGVPSLTQASVAKAYPTYTISPSGTQTFWAEPAGAFNNLYVGDPNAANQKQIAATSQYAPYGWYGDKYVLVTKDHNELYIMPAASEKSGWQAVKISDYYRAVVPVDGYTYGGR